MSKKNFIIKSINITQTLYPKECEELLVYLEAGWEIVNATSMEGRIVYILKNGKQN